MIPNKIIIIGSGASIRQGLWDTPIEELPIWEAVKNQFTISCNWSFKWVDPTISMFCDHRFYCLEKEHLDKLPILLTAKKNGFYNDERKYKKYFDKIGDNLHFLKVCGGVKYKEHTDVIHNGVNTQLGGIYTPQLTGLMAIGYALSIGCKELYLLGFDAGASQGRTHFYEGDKEHTGIVNWNNQTQTGVGLDANGRCKNDNYNEDINWWFHPLTNNDADVKIYNVSPESNITVFPKISFSEFYKVYTTNKKIDQRILQEELERLL